MTYMILNLPYAALLTFEAVVRLNGFSAAALELGVSQSAVSQHVKSLEEWLKEELLIRGRAKIKAYTLWRIACSGSLKRVNWDI